MFNYRCLATAYALLVALGMPVTVVSVHSVVVDDKDSAISYSGTWHDSGALSTAYDGSHMYSKDPGATATFTFTGSALEFISPQWSYLVTTQVTIDGSSSIVLDMQDDNKPGSDGDSPDLGWSSIYSWSLSSINEQHNVVLSMASGGEWIVVDALKYTVVDDTTTATSGLSSASSQAASTSTFSATSEESSTSTSSLHKSRPIIIGASAGVGGLALVGTALLLFLLCKRRQRDEDEARKAPNNMGHNEFIRPSKPLHPSPGMYQLPAAPYMRDVSPLTSGMRASAALSDTTFGNYDADLWPHNVGAAETRPHYPSMYPYAPAHMHTRSIPAALSPGTSGSPSNDVEHASAAMQSRYAGDSPLPPFTMHSLSPTSGAYDAGNSFPPRADFAAAGLSQASHAVDNQRREIERLQHILGTQGKDSGPSSSKEGLDERLNYATPSLGSEPSSIQRQRMELERYRQMSFGSVKAVSSTLMSDGGRPPVDPYMADFDVRSLYDGNSQGSSTKGMCYHRLHTLALSWTQPI